MLTYILLDRYVKQYFFSTCSTDNEIDGRSFIDLSWSEVRELVKPLGIAKKLARLQKEVGCICVCLAYNVY